MLPHGHQNEKQGVEARFGAVKGRPAKLPEYDEDENGHACQVLVLPLDILSKVINF